MGADYWDCYAPFHADLITTLEMKRRRDFEAGYFEGSDLNPRTIEEAIANSGADGTCSILDMERIASSPDAGAASPFTDEQLTAIFGTSRPTRAMVEEALRDSREAMDEAVEEIGRGEGRYILLYEGDRPTEVFFCGYSYD